MKNIPLHRALHQELSLDSRMYNKSPSLKLSSSSAVALYGKVARTNFKFLGFVGFGGAGLAIFFINDCFYYILSTEESKYTI